MQNKFAVYRLKLMSPQQLPCVVHRDNIQLHSCKGAVCLCIVSATTRALQSVLLCLQGQPSPCAPSGHVRLPRGQSTRVSACARRVSPATACAAETLNTRYHHITLAVTLGNLLDLDG